MEKIKLRNESHELTLDELQDARDKADELEAVLDGVKSHASFLKESLEASHEREKDLQEEIDSQKAAHDRHIAGIQEALDTSLAFPFSLPKSIKFV